MVKRLIFIALLITTIVWWCQQPRIEATTANVTFDYRVKYTGDADSSARLPMLVALHGNGDTPDHFFDTALDLISIPARVVLLKAPIGMGHGSSWPMDSTGLQQYARAISEIMPLLQQRYPTRKKPALLGFSGGGVMAYYLSAAHPEQFSFIVAISGRLSSDNLAADKDHHSDTLNVFAFHGVQDAVINISGGRTARQLLQARGTRITLQEFQGGHLGIFTNMKPTINQLLDEKLKLLLYGV